MIDYLSSHKGLFAFSDPGGAKAVLALVNQLQGEGYSDYKVISDRTYPFFEQFEVAVDEVKPEDLLSALNDYEPDFIFCGTSYTSSLETNCIKHARNKSITSYSFIDHWTSLKERFKLGDSYIFPSTILVIDEKAVEMGIKEGLPKELLKVFPNPYLTYLSTWSPGTSRKEFLAKHALAGFEGKIIAFLPEPLTNVGGVEKFGLDEFSCMELLKNAISSFDQNKLRLLIKPHPNQDLVKMKEEGLNIMTRNNINYAIIEEDINTLIYYSDLIIGIFSNALIEAASFDKPIVRILEGLIISDPLASSDVGTTVYSTKELITNLKLHLG